MLAQQMLATVVGWDLYLTTRSPVVLGNVGLVQIIPVLLFTFVAGHVADRYNRSRTAMVTQVAQALVDAGHQLCPYSKATRGNIDVTINLV